MLLHRSCLSPTVRGLLIKKKTTCVDTTSPPALVIGSRLNVKRQESCRMAPNPNPNGRVPVSGQFLVISSDLYESQSMSLKLVVQTMQDKHDFFATPRMYKARFGRWGLRKNLGYKLYGELLRQQMDRDAAGKPSRAFIRGQKVRWDRLEAYIRRQPDDKQIQIMDIAFRSKALRESSPSPSAVSCSTPSPGPTISFLLSTSAR
ncbi:hypothetical protein BJ170DRAFT_628395 [Xylariales sp. AK1849]|nr:hypothetical protein BJ170DRAFT_628395 [Xylariales sp. AK1849]